MFLYLNCKWPSFRSRFWFRLSTVNEIQKQRKEVASSIYACICICSTLFYSLLLLLSFINLLQCQFFLLQISFFTTNILKLFLFIFFTITFFHIKYFTSIQDAVHLYHSHFKAGAFDLNFFYIWIIFHFSRLKNMLFIYICIGFYNFIYSFCTICISISI